jgi:hypothetical protein
MPPKVASLPTERKVPRLIAMSGAATHIASEQDCRKKRKNDQRQP